MTLLAKLFARRGEPKPKPMPKPETPPDTRIYAIGDIHGRLDLLQPLHRMIEDDAADFARARRALIYLGDYIDRGPSSRQVIELLLDSPLPGFETVHLGGNHEEMMLGFLDDASAGPVWEINGGDATMASYGVDAVDEETGLARAERMRSALSGRIAPAHVEFLRALGNYHIEGDYMFVHAGVMPGLRIEQQIGEYMRWIRDDFVNSEIDHGKCVVHGHTIVAEPEIRPNRVAIDTGAYFSNTLTCLVLDGAEKRFLHT